MRDHIMAALLLFSLLFLSASISALPSQYTVLRAMAISNSTQNDPGLFPNYAAALKSQVFCADEPKGAKVDIRLCDFVLNELRHDKAADHFFKYRAPGGYEFSPLPCAIDLVPIGVHTPPIRLSFLLIAAFADRILAECHAQGQGGINRLFDGWYLMVNGGAVEWPRRMNVSASA